MSTDLFLAVDKNPQDVKAFETLVKTAVGADDRASLELVYEAVPRWAPGNAQNHMVRVLSQYTRTAPVAELQAWMSYKNGLLFWKTYGDAQMAEMAFRKVESLPAEPGAAELLRGFYTDFYVAQGNWRRLEQVLTEPAKGGFDDPTMVRRMLGQLAEEKDQADKAIGFWGQVRASDPTDIEAEEALRRLYTKVGKWNAMVDLLKEQLDRYSDEEVDEKTIVHLEMIDIYKNKLNAPAKVVASWQSILDINPGNVQALDALAAEYTEMKRWPDLVKVLAQKVEHETDPKKLVALHKQIANIHQERFNNANEAIKSWEAILELENDNREALKTLKDIYEQRRDYDNLVAVSERELDLVTDEKKRFKQLVDLARMASEKLRKPQTPIALWERVLETDSTHKDALHELETWFEREKNWERLAEILERRIELETDTPTQVGLLDKLGNVVSSRLGDAERAADVWRRILARDREHRKAQGELRKKYVAERDWDGLEWFFRNYGDVAEWVRTLEQQVKAIDEPEEKTTLLFKAAAVWRDELKDTRRAVKNLEAVLEIEPRHAETSRMLIPIYQELGSWKDLPNVYEIALESTEDPHERRDLLLALAAVHEDKLDDVESSFFNFVQAVSENPSDVALHPKLRQLAERSANWESYVHVLEDSVDHIESDQHRVEVLLEIGHTYRDRLGADESSLTFFYRVLSLDAYNGPALDAAERAWEATGQYDQLVLTYQKRLTTLTDPAARLTILFKLADVWRNLALANDEAEAVLVEMLEDYPDELRVHDELIEIRLEEKRFADLRDVLEKKRDVLVGQKARSHVLADIEHQLGLLAFGTGDDDVAGAIAQAIDRFEAALGHDPVHADTVARLEDLLCDEGEQLRVTRLLAPVYELTDAFGKLSQVFELQWAAAKQDDDTVAQIDLLTRLGGLYRGASLGLSETNDELAWRTQARLFLLKPEAGEVRAELQALTETLSRWQELVTLYSQEADTPLEKESRLAIKLEVARTWHRRLSDPDGGTSHLEEAKTFYQKVREEEPEHKESIDALEEIYVALDRAEDLLEIYRGQIDLSSDTDKKIDYLFRTVDLMRDRLEDADGAIAPAQEALALSPGHLGAISRLDDLFTRTERWEDLAQTLDDTIRIVDHDQKRVIELKNRLALVHEKHLERPDTAIEIHASVLAVDPENDNAIDALERLFEREELAPTVAPILEPVYQRSNDWQRLIDVYTVREQASGDFNEKVDWHYKIAALYEGPGQQPEAAFNHYEEAAHLDPGSELTLSELLRLADSLDNHGELILFLQSIVEDIPSIERRIETHRTIAVLARDKTNDLPGADKQFRAILDIDPTDMAATDALIALYRDSKDTKNLVEMLLKKAPMAQVSTAQRNGLYAEAGNLASDVLSDHAQAIEIFETLHGLDPNGDTALDSLERLYELTSDWDNLVRIYREKIDRAGELEKKKHYAALTGMVQADQLESPEDAIATWLQILGWDGTDRDALTQLDLLYSQQGDWFNLKETLRKVQALEVDATMDEGLVSTPIWDEAQFRIAKLHEDPEKLGDLDTAIDCYGVLLGRNLQHAGSVTALETIIAERESYQKAFAVLRPFLEARSGFEELWQQYEVLVAHEDLDPERRVATLHEMADLGEIRLGDSRRALEAQARAFSVSPRDAHTGAELERLAQQYGFWEELVAIYTKEANVGDDELLTLDLRLKAGRILMDRIGDDVRATAAYELIAKDNPDHTEVQERLHQLYERRGMWKELAGILRMQADAEGVPATRIAFLEKLAMVSEAKLKDQQKAYEALVEILDIDRTSEHASSELRRLFELGVNPLDIAERLEPLYRDGARWEELDSLLQLKLAVLDDTTDQQQLMRDLAILAIERRGNERDALEWYGQALLIDPEDEGLYVEMERLAGLTGAWDRLDHYTLNAADIVADKERKIELWQKAGPIARDRLGDLAGAEATFRKVIALDAKHANALRAIDALLVSASRWEDLEPILLAQTEADDLFDDERIQVWTRLAELYRDRLGESDSAIGAYKQVLELQDMNEGALTALRDIYGERQMWPELFDILQRLSDLSRNVDERVDQLSTMAEIAEQHLGQPNRAIELYEDVLAARPDDIEAVRQLERLLLAQARKSKDEGEREKLFSALAESYERELRMESVGLQKDRKLEVFRLLGRLWQSELDDPFNAQNAWERARTEEPFDREALDALRGLHLASGNDQARGEIIESQIISERYSPEEQLVLWRELAEIRTEVFGDQNGGIEAWQSVLALARPGHDDYAKAIAELEVLYENTQRWQDLVSLYGKKLELIDADDKRVETQLFVGTIQQDNLQDAAAAALTYRAILDEPGVDIASEGETLRTLRLEASRRIEVIYEASEQWSPLAELLLVRNERLELEDKVQNLQRLAQIHEHKLGEQVDAFVVLQSANELVPDEPMILAELERLAETTGLWSDLYGVYESSLVHLEGDEQLELMLKSAAIQRDRIGSRPEAVRLYERVLENQSDNDTALRALIDLNEAESRFPQLVEVMRTLAELTPDYGEKKLLLQRVAQVEETQLNNLENAVLAYTEVLDMDERDKAVLAELERLHIARRDWHALIDIYEKDAMADPSVEVNRRLQIAGIYESYTRQLDEAIAAYEDVLGVDPANDVALDKLERIYSEREDYDSLLDVYERAYNAARNDEDRLRMAKNAAILHEGYRNDMRSASDAWSRVLQLDPVSSEAFESLTRIYTHEKEWDDLIRLYEQRYEVAEDGDGRADALLAMAAVYRNQRDDIDNATAMYERVLLERRNDQTALNALDELFSAEGRWEQVIENIDKKLEVEVDLETRVDLLCRQGLFAKAELGDNYRSAASYTRVLQESPGNEVAVSELLTLYKEDERWDKVLETLNHKLIYAKTRIDAAAIHVDLAEVLSDKLGQADQALTHFEEAEKADPESRRALQVLADHYVKTGQHAKAMTRLEALIDKLDPHSDRELLGQTHKKIGLCAEALFLDDQAIDELTTASGIMPLDLEGLRALGRLHYKRGNYREAERYLQEVLDKYKRDLSSDDQVKVLMHLGESALKTKNIQKAQLYLRQVVEAQPNNPKALENIIEVLRAHGELNDALKYMEHLLTLKDDKVERYQILMGIGDICHQELGDKRRAVEAYRSALDLEVLSKAPALRLFELHLQGEDYVNAMSNLNRLIKLEEDPKVKAKYANMAAVVYREKLKDPVEAVKYYNVSLDFDIERLTAFESIVQVLTQLKDNVALNKNYRRMIERVIKAGSTLPNADALLFQLFMGLGEIYRSRLREPNNAVPTFELAKDKRPDDPKVREILAELYETTDALDKAINEHRWMIAREPANYESYRSLMRLFKKARWHDAAWCVSGLLVALRRANAEETAFYERYRSPSMAEPNRVVDPAIWSECILSRQEDPELSRVIEIVYAALGKARVSKNAKDYQLKKKSRLELNEGLLVTNTIAKVLRMFGVAAPEMYKGELASGIEFLQTDPPMLRFGVDVLQGLGEKDLAFHIARRLSYFAPSHLVAILYPREALDGLYLGAAMVVDPNYQIATHEGVAEEDRMRLVQAATEARQVLEKNLTPELRQQLTATMRSLWRRTPVPELGRWHRAVELTAIHAGVVASSDPALALTLLQAEPHGMSRLTKQDKLKDHVLYSISDPYLMLRKQLGLQIDYSDLMG